MAKIDLQLQQLMQNDPIVITGMGCISSAGSSVEELWKSVYKLETNVEFFRIENKGVHFEIPICRIKEIPIESEIERKINKFDRSIRLGIYAAYQTISSTGISDDQEYEKIGVIAGTSRGAINQLAEFLSYNEYKRILPSYSSNTSIGALSGAIAKSLDLRGPSMTISANCASSAIAIAIGAQQILLNMSDSVISGGAEAPLNPHVLTSMLNAKILEMPNGTPARICKPFDTNRNGTVLGEGAGFLHLERMSSAIQRKAKIHAVLKGFAYSIAPCSPMGIEPNGESLAKIIEKALKVSGVTLADISFISLHGTGTKINDVAETRAVKHIFGKSNPNVPVYSIKPVTGHCLGASAALEAIICIKALNESIVPATANCEEIDSECNVNVIINKPIKINKSENALLITSGFWGYKAALVFGKI